ncbi:GntR family transcriptional regulator [Nocardia sp. alder85J]|uniref:GntR family transcriptional regulator n=1 Tax=Nocardia sp. alder85J TaxID=2862949 RepID=UPI001CD76EC1|nr:GntR family transcriptional regulator [Nocardia sp. alder85J]MCX4091726.1 GntR family transcriptional regulator [Nocardia sp. alder85J]
MGAPLGRRRGPIGLWSRLHEIWLESARAGAPMPGEPTLAARLDASRPAIREALVRLEERGYIHRRQGADTLVNRRMLEVSARIDEQIDRAELIASTGRRASMTVVDNTIGTPTAAESQRYEVADDRPLLRVTKLWCADDVPVILAHDAVLLAEPISEEIDGGVPIFDIARRWGSGAPEWEIVHPAAVAAPDTDAALLGIEPGRPALALTVVGVGSRGDTAYWASELHATEAFQHTLIRLVRR